MSAEPFIAEIQILGCNFAPRGYALCNGQLLSIAQNTALFSLLGTTYGGDGRTTFGLPDLRGRAPLSQGQGPGLSDYVMGESLGEPSVTLLTNQLPGHTHTVNCNNDAGSNPSPGGNVLSSAGADRSLVQYSDATSGTTVSMNPGQLGLSGSSQPHNNMSPYLTLNYCIAIQGIFPARN